MKNDKKDRIKLAKDVPETQQAEQPAVVTQVTRRRTKASSKIQQTAIVSVVSERVTSFKTRANSISATVDRPKNTSSALVED